MSSQRSFSRPISPAHQPPTSASGSSSGTSTSPSVSGTSGQTSTNTVSSPGSTGPHSIVHRPQNTNPSTPPVDPPADWYPFTLRWYFLVVPIFLSLLFGISSICLHFYSRQHDGLGRDDNSSMVLFAWRFLPTLIAVLYTQLTVIIFEDVKRTEPFARLAKSPSAGATAYGTLLQTPKSWWAISYDIIFKRKLMGKTGWSLIAALIVHVLALIAISPLSSALLATEEVVVTKTFDFTRSSPAEGIQLPMNITRETYLRIMASISRNVSTSAWTSDDSFTFPVWPSSEEQQVGPRISSDQNSWQVEAITYSTAYSCSNMTLEKTELRNFTYRQADYLSVKYGKEHTGEGPMVVYTLNSETGCRYQLKSHPIVEIAYEGGITWSDASTYNYQEDGVFRFDGRLFDANLTDTSPWARVNASKQCAGHDIITISTPWTAPIPASMIETMSPDQTKFRKSPDFRMRALLCSSTYTSKTDTIKIKMALGEETTLEHVPETITRSSDLFDSSFDRKSFQSMSTDGQWPIYFGKNGNPPPVEENDEGEELLQAYTLVNGPGAALSIAWKYNYSKMIEAPELVETARRIKGRMFAETVRSALSKPELLKQEIVQGTASVREERIVVLPEIAIALCTLFLLSFFLLLSLFWTSRVNRRPLQLRSDPGSAVGLSALLHPQRTHLATLKRMHSAPRQEISKILRSETFRTSGGILYQGNIIPGSGTSPGNNTKKRDWRPRAIHLKTLVALCSFLLLITAAIVVLYTFGTSSKLYQKVFTYDTDLSKFGLSISSFAPISIAPAVISIVITLWWDQVDATFRLLQPYIAMSQEPTPIRRGAGLTYRSKTWFGAAVKAAKHRHWILFMVAIGSTLCQVLTVSMSALFERRMDQVSHELSMNRTLQMRQYPVLTEIGSYISKSGLPTTQVVNTMFKNTSSNWLYNAVAQLSLDGPQPTWTKDEWSFMPVDLSQTIDTSEQQATLNSSFSTSTALNITISTSAIRVRIECDAIPEIHNSSSWLGPKEGGDFESEEMIQNVTGLRNFKAFRRYIFEGTHANTTVFTNENMLQCCKNGTGSRSEPTAFGHWSPVNAGTGISDDDSSPKAFVPKWIVGEPTFAITRPSYPTQMIFEENPELQAAVCIPVIETTEATVLVDQITGIVQTYSLEGPPAPYDLAWSEAYLRRAPTNAQIHFNKTYDGALNITTSFGVLFFDTLFGAANRVDGDNGYENLKEDSYTFRDQVNGLNLDLMSYSMYTMVDKDLRALLNYTTLTTYANQTVQTFFQHFIQSGLNLTSGGYAYQAIDDHTMSTLGHAIDENGTAISQPIYPAFNTGRTVVATVTNRIQILYLNPAATFLSIGILLWLVGTAAVVICVQRRYTRSMLRNVELIADVLVLVAGSENFLNLVQERGVVLKRDENVCTKLGWFKGRDGEVRWGVEVVGGRNAVEWVDPPK